MKLFLAQKAFLSKVSVLSISVAPFTLSLLVRDKSIPCLARAKIDSVNTQFGLGSVVSAYLFSPDQKVGSGPVLSCDSG